MSSIEDVTPMPDLGGSSKDVEGIVSENDVETGQVKSQRAPEPPQLRDASNKDGSENNDIENGRKRHSIAESLILGGAHSSSATKNIYKEYEFILVLVNLDLLNSISSNRSSSSNNNNNVPTTIPVNKFGFPPGYGRNLQERSGPYLFVACSYKNIRRLSTSEQEIANNIVTVERCDTGEWVKIKPEWETYVLDERGAVLAAWAASKMNGPDRDDFETAIEHLKYSEASGTSNPDTSHTFQPHDAWMQLVDRRVFPIYRRCLTATKAIGTQLVQGARPFSCKVRITGINLLVACSTLFLFLQVFQLGWVPPEYDDDLANLELVIWCILVVELIFEILIRPANYKGLMKSEKAYRPSTARHINPMFVAGETLALLLYIPEIICFGKESTDVCLSEGNAGRLLLVNASAAAILGPKQWESLVGRLVLGSMALRFFGVVRHWQHMLIQQTFHPTPRVGLEKWVIPFDPASRLERRKRKKLEAKQRNEDSDDDNDDDEIVDIDTAETDIDFSESKESRRLKSAANIGTALIVVNCQRALVLMVLSVLVVPLFYTVTYQNRSAYQMTKLLQAENLVSTTGLYDCDYLEQAIDSWLNMAIVDQLEFDDNDTGETPYVLWAQVLPVRCPFQDRRGVITSCSGKQSRFREMVEYNNTCSVWDSSSFVPRVDYDDTTNVREHFARTLNIRGDGILVNQEPRTKDYYGFDALNSFQVRVVFNQNPTIEGANQKEFILLVVVFLLGLSFLVVLRNDVYALALNPIQRMLKIVIRYAENPLSGDAPKRKSNAIVTRSSSTFRGNIGDIETEQLLSAITKISDLLRKCWGVAGAGIISSNLGRQKDGQVAVFNPTVPGKQVYALFGFVAICGYSQLLKALDGDVMILINDIASVVHDEVYRWALGDHGQCNKNLGPAFLMVWRIGDFNEVQQKNKAAIEKLFRDKVYKTTTKNHPNLRRRNIKSPYSKNTASSSTATTLRSVTSTSSSMSQEIQLESLPGIQGFADRALLGMLKSFAGLHRDRHLQDWKNDPRLRSYGSSYSVDVIYGMDAGWAVEGAVGSEYKIDATYLSPHVNMASRMMSASKQYGATILLSKAVQKLLSKPCRKKLRHLDTVYVKGSAIKQAIYTYDARSAGVDFFLIERTPEQADRDSESYSPAIWDQDPDLLAMRRHATDEFMETYHNGVKHYLEGNWKDAYELFEMADDIMIRTVLEEGYIEIADDDLLDALEARILNKNDMGEDVVKLRHEFGDGACRTLMNYIQRRNFEAPDDWSGVRKLFSK